MSFEARVIVMDEPTASLSRHEVQPLFRVISQGRVKVSLRSVGNVDVAAFAKAYGGGGHTKAAGLSILGSMAEVQATVLKAAREYLGRNGGSRVDGGSRV